MASEMLCRGTAGAAWRRDGANEMLTKTGKERDREADAPAEIHCQ